MSKPHRYEYDITPNGAPDRVIRIVGENRRVLELGSGPGTITKSLSANGCNVTALEIDATAIEIVRSFTHAVYPCDFNNPDWPSTVPEFEKFDTIVAADVLEHLNDPLSCLKATHKYMTANARLVVSLPHAGHAGVIACLINSDFEYRSWGLLDSTHVRFFGLKNIQKLFEDAGFKITEVEFVVTSPENSELFKQWNELPNAAQKTLLEGKYSNIYQVVLVAKPQDAEGNNLDLLSQEIPQPTSGAIRNRIKNHSAIESIKNALPPGTKNKLKKIMQKFND